MNNLQSKPAPQTASARTAAEEAAAYGIILPIDLMYNVGAISFIFSYIFIRKTSARAPRGGASVASEISKRVAATRTREQRIATAEYAA